MLKTFKRSLDGFRSGRILDDKELRLNPKLREVDIAIKSKDTTERTTYFKLVKSYILETTT